MYGKQPCNPGPYYNLCRAYEPSGLRYRSRASEDDDSPGSKKALLTSSPPTSVPLMTLQQSSNGELSPEQLLRMEKKKVEAEARLVAKKLGANAIGVSWVQALQSELKKGYFEKV